MIKAKYRKGGRKAVENRIFTSGIATATGTATRATIEPETDRVMF